MLLFNRSKSIGISSYFDIRLKSFLALRLFDDSQITCYIDLGLFAFGIPLNRFVIVSCKLVDQCCRLSITIPIANKAITGDFSALSHSFFCRPAEVVGPELIGCLLVKCQTGGSLLWGVIVETEAYSQDEPACHGYRRRSPSNETLFGEPGRFYVYVSYGIHHCVKRAVSSRSSGWA